MYRLLKDKQGVQQFLRTSLAPLVAISLMAIIPAICLRCEFKANWLEALSLPFATAIMFCDLGLLVFGIFRNKGAVILLAISALAIPFGQLLLLWSDPKFCILCVGIGICSLSIGIVLLSSIVPMRLQVYSISKKMKIATMLVVALLVAKIAIYSALPGGNVPAAPQGLGELVGTDVGDLFRGSYSEWRKENSQPGSANTPILILGELPGCESCANARSALSYAGIKYLQANPCSTNRQTNCFYPQGDFLAPLILVVKGRKIIY